MASSFPSLYSSPTKNIRFNPLQGVSRTLLECSPCVSLTFLTFRPPPRAQSQAVILYFFSLETFFCSSLCTPPSCSQVFLCSLRLAFSQTAQRERVFSANGPPRVPQDSCSLRSHNQALSIRAHLLIVSPCSPLIYNSAKSSSCLKNLDEPIPVTPTTNYPPP